MDEPKLSKLGTKVLRELIDSVRKDYVAVDTNYLIEQGYQFLPDSFVFLRRNLLVEQGFLVEVEEPS